MEIFKGMPGSPITYLAADISGTQTTISVADDTALPDAPNLCTIGYGEEIETIRYETKTNGVLQNVTRGVEGAPRSWQAGTECARYFTATDHNAIAEILQKNPTWFAELEEKIINEVNTKILKNLFGKNDKIHAGEIATEQGILLPDAIIVESGNNENGHYVKHGDGTMACRYTLANRTVSNVEASTQGISVRRSSRISWEYPHPFIEDPVIELTGACLNGGELINTQLGNRVYDKTSSGVAFQFFALEIFNTVDYNITATGRWKN